MEDLPEAPVERRSAAWLMVPAVLIAGAALVWLMIDRTTSPTRGSDVSPTAVEREPQTADAAQTIPVAAAPDNNMPAGRNTMPRETGTRSLDQEARRGLGPRTAGNSPPRAPVADTPAARPQPVTPGTVRILEPGDGAVLPAENAGTVKPETLPEYRSTLIAGDVPIPQLHLDMHVYSRQPDKRFVFINLEKYTEGDQIDGDTVVESIEAQGAVINHKGYRFVLRPE